MNQQDLDDFFNLINLLSLALGYENLIENRKQSAYNDVHNANQQQADYLLREIKKLFLEQNKILAKILLRLNKLNGGNFNDETD